jgi:hypothetical protein
MVAEKEVISWATSILKRMAAKSKIKIKELKWKRGSGVG